MRLALLLLAACGARDVAQPDYGPPSQPIDPIACPADILDRFASRVGIPIAITTEQIVEAARIDKVPCKPDEKDDACISRARQRPVPSSYEVAGITVTPDDTRIEGSYRVDGRIVTAEFPDLSTFINQMKSLASEHEVVVMSSSTLGDGSGRHAAIAYRGVGGRQRRIGTIRWNPSSMHAGTSAEAQATERDRVMTEARVAAEYDHLEVRRMTTEENGDLVITVTCGPGIL